MLQESLPSGCNYIATGTEETFRRAGLLVAIIATGTEESFRRAGLLAYILLL
jgi:hypothetical protein